MIASCIKKAVEGVDLTAAEVGSAMDAILNGSASSAQIAAFVVALRMKGESSTEIAAAAASLRKQCELIQPKVAAPLLDTCGSVGGGLHTFNISSAAAIVAAGCGVAVAKHGNRAVSSKSGSADVLEALGVRIDLDAEAVKNCIEDVGIGFLFAPSHHAAMRHAAPVRRELGLRTIFNLLGPLVNPASATHQVVGVFDGGRVEQLAEALGVLGLEAAWVVHGEGGLDEVSPSGVTLVASLEDGLVRTFQLTPDDFGLEPVPLEALRGGDAEENATIITRVLDGETGPPRTAVVLNAAAGLCVTGHAKNPKEAAAQAAQAIDNGAAARTLAQWVAHTQGS